MNEPRAWSAGLPALGGVGTASALAKFYQAAIGSIPSPLPVRLRQALATPQSSGDDRVLLRPTVFTCGAQQDPLDDDGRKLRHIYGPSISAFGHPGAGGSHGFGDPETGISFAYVMNQMNLNVMPGVKCVEMVDALFSESETAGSLERLPELVLVGEGEHERRSAARWCGGCRRGGRFPRPSACSAAAGKRARWGLPSREWKILSVSVPVKRLLASCWIGVLVSAASFSRRLTTSGWLDVPWVRVGPAPSLTLPCLAASMPGSVGGVGDVEADADIGLQAVGRHHRAVAADFLLHGIEADEREGGFSFAGGDAFHHLGDDVAADPVVEGAADDAAVREFHRPVLIDNTKLKLGQRQSKLFTPFRAILNALIDTIDFPISVHLLVKHFLHNGACNHDLTLVGAGNLFQPHIGIILILESVSFVGLIRKIFTLLRLLFSQGQGDARTARRPAGLRRALPVDRSTLARSRRCNVVLDGANGMAGHDDRRRSSSACRCDAERCHFEPDGTLPALRAEPAARGEPRVHHRARCARAAPTSASPGTATPTAASSSTTPASSCPATSSPR